MSSGFSSVYYEGSSWISPIFKTTGMDSTKPFLVRPWARVFLPHGLGVISWWYDPCWIWPQGQPSGLTVTVPEHVWDVTAVHSGGIAAAKNLRICLGLVCFLFYSGQGWASFGDPASVLGSLSSPKA